MRPVPGLRRALLVFGTIGAAAVVACSEPAAPPAAPPGSGTPSSATDVLGSLGLLQCTPLGAGEGSALIGPQGGTIGVGPHTFVVPAGALPQPTQITATIVTGPANTVHFEPEGLEFTVPARLTMSYANCGLVVNLVPKRIAFTSDLLEILEYVPSVDNLFARTVTGEIRHFSDYAVAW